MSDVARTVDARLRPPALRRAVVIGGAGFIGSHLCDALVEAGTDVLCVDNLATGLLQNVEHLIGRPRFRLVEADVTRELPVEGGADAVFHLALPTAADHLGDPAAAVDQFTAGLLRSLDYARRNSSRFVLASSSEVYGDTGADPQPEDVHGAVDPCDPRGLPAVLRAFSEAVTSAHRAWLGVDTAIVRLFNTYGPRMRADDGRALVTFIRRAADDAPLVVPGAGGDRYSMCYVADAVRGLVRMATSALPGPLNIGDPEGIPLAALVERIVALTGSGSDVEFVPGGSGSVRRPDTALAARLLDWEASVSVDEGLAATIDSIRVRARIA